MPNNSESRDGVAKGDSRTATSAADQVRRFRSAETYEDFLAQWGDARSSAEQAGAGLWKQLRSAKTDLDTLAILEARANDLMFLQGFDFGGARGVLSTQEQK